MPQIIDLSQEIFTDAPRLPPHPATKLEWVATHEEAAKAPVQAKDITYAAMMLHMCDHGPTHVDAVAHIDERPSAPTIDQSPLKNFLTPAIALDFTGMVEPKQEIPLELLKRELDKHKLTPPKDGTFLLSLEGGEFLYRECGVINVGADAPSIEPGKNLPKLISPCHLLCRELQRHNSENLANIEEVAGKEFTFIGLPLKIREGSGSPIRAVALLDGPF